MESISIACDSKAYYGHTATNDGTGLDRIL